MIDIVLRGSNWLRADLRQGNNEHSHSHSRAICLWVGEFRRTGHLQAQN
jgi:hypothetical protein